MKTTKISMKDMLAEGLYLLLQEKSFDKITIKQICDKTGVIRGTFYNHFYDKYEALEYLTRMILLKDEETYEKNKRNSKLLRGIFTSVSENKDFFKAAFQIEGQNSFAEILQKILEDVSFDLLKDIEVKEETISKNIHLFVSYHANAILFLIKDWVFSKKPITIEELCMLCEQFFFKKTGFFDKIR